LIFNFIFLPFNLIRGKV